MSNKHEADIVAETWARRENAYHFRDNWCVALLSKDDVHMSSCTRSARIRPPRHAKCLAPPLRSVAAPRRGVAPLTVINVKWHNDLGLARHLPDRDCLAQVPRGDRDDRVAVPTMRAGLVTWNNDVVMWQPVASPGEAWHPLRRGDQHMVDLR